MANIQVRFNAEQTRRIVAEAVERIRLDVEAIREEGCRQGWAEAIAALRDRPVDPYQLEDCAREMADYLAAQADERMTQSTHHADEEATDEA